MSLEVTAFSSTHAEAWDQFCSTAPNATFLHTRRFLSYHGERFEDASAVLLDGTELVGVFPAARSAAEPNRVVSHPGATYGGLVHQGQLLGNRMIDALQALASHYRLQNFAALEYKALPYIFAQTPAQDDLYALHRLGANRYRCDLSCAIDLAHRRPPSERRRRGVKKALKHVELSEDLRLLDELMEVINENLSRKHQAVAVHSANELALLCERFPENIAIRCALEDGRVKAGVVFFNCSLVWHTQYIASSERGYEISALDAVFDAAIAEARESGARYFDFGTSNEDGGAVLNHGLYRFKSEFGGAGVAYEFYDLPL